jgi:tRNA threonylcarbamoyl adenosine modification protein YeaZ
MKLLAFEFSSRHRSVAVLSTGSGGTTCFEAVETGGTGPLHMVEQALRNAGFEREQIECIAIGLGPGSYTGIRAAIALAQGWELVSRVKLLGVGSDEVLAEEARKQGIFGRISVAIDAQRNEFYVRTFEIGEQACQALDALRLATFDETQRTVQRGQIVISPDAPKLPGSRLLLPGASTLAALARHRTDFISGENLSPIYLRQTAFVKAPPPRRLTA